MYILSTNAARRRLRGSTGMLRPGWKWVTGLYFNWIIMLFFPHPHPLHEWWLVNCRATLASARRYWLARSNKRSPPQLTGLLVPLPVHRGPLCRLRASYCATKETTLVRAGRRVVMCGTDMCPGARCGAQVGETDFSPVERSRSWAGGN